MNCIKAVVPDVAVRSLKQTAALNVLHRHWIDRVPNIHTTTSKSIRQIRIRNIKI